MLTIPKLRSERNVLLVVTLLLVSLATIVFRSQMMQGNLPADREIFRLGLSESLNDVVVTSHLLAKRWRIPPLESVHLSLENTHHLDFDTPLGDKEWNATLPAGGAVVYLGPNRHAYTVGMFHRLRCLNIIRKNLAEFYADDSPEAKIPQATLVHHCMNYLRQMVLCDSDLTLESIRSDRGNHLTTWDVTHKCKDWSSVYKEAEKNWMLFNRPRE